MTTGDEPTIAAEASTGAPTGQMDPSALMRSNDYRRLLVAAAAIGLVVSCLSWAFLRDHTPFATLGLRGSARRSRFR